MRTTTTMYCEDCGCDVEVVDVGFDRYEGLDADDQTHVREGHDLSDANWQDDGR